MHLSARNMPIVLRDQMVNNRSHRPRAAVAAVGPADAHVLHRKAEFNRDKDALTGGYPRYGINFKANMCRALNPPPPPAPSHGTHILLP